MPLEPASSLADLVVTMAPGEHVVAAGFLNETPVLALADGRVHYGTEYRETGAGGMLAACFDAQRLLTGHDDGRVALTSRSGGTELVADEKGRWIDALALGPGGAFAWSCGRKVTVRDGKGGDKSEMTLSTCQGLAFRPKGYCLAMAQNGGVLLWMPNTLVPIDHLDWKGSHLDVTFSPDSRFVVSSMQENQLHGWRMPEKAHMRMSGYPSKPRSFSWSMDGNWLATSGAEAAIVWPFSGKEGPMGKAPRECGVRPKRVSKVAFHPKSLVLAIGYEDGFILLVRLTDGAEILIRAETSGDRVTALAWDSAGKRLIFGTADGAAGYLALPL